MTLDHPLRCGNRLPQRRADHHRGPWNDRCGGIEIGNLAGHDLIELAHGRLRLGRRPGREALSLGHQARLFIRLTKRLQTAVAGRLCVPTHPLPWRHPHVQRGRAGSCRLHDGGRTLGPPNKGSQIDIRTHPVIEQQAIGLVICLLCPLGRFGVNHVLQGGPVRTRQTGRHPTVHCPAGNHLGAQHVTRGLGGFAVRRATDRLQPRTQIGVLRTCQIGNGLRQAGHQQASLDRTVIHQGQLTNGPPGR